MDWDYIDWGALTRMRQEFLESRPGCGDYWRSEADLASYDFTFGRRIGWKWDFVLAELRKLNWSPPAGPVVDWGCGSGVAGRAFLRHFGNPNSEFGIGPAKLVLDDRSELAMRFAAGRAKEYVGSNGGQPGPGLEIEAAAAPDLADATLLISHVLTELAEPQRRRLLDKAANATAIIWVEPGTHQASRALLAVREELRRTGNEGGRFNLVAPCTHQALCGLLAPGMDRHWCHHFATPPAEVFTDGNWVRFGRLAGIDLRSLPLSFLVLDRRPIRPLPADAMRIIGRPRVEKGFASLFGCDESGVHQRRAMKRLLPEQFRQFKRGDFQTLTSWQCEGEQIVRLGPLRIEPAEEDAK